MSAALKQQATPRERLAEAIAEREARTARVKAIEKALEELRTARYSLNADVSKARETLETAKKDVARHLADRAMGIATEQAITPKQAQLALTEAEERAQEAQTAYEELKLQHVGATQDRAYGEHVLRKAVTEALAAAPEVAQLLNLFNARRAEVAALHSALLLLSSALPNGWGSTKDHRDIALAQRWQLAIDRLEKDANAPLPK